MLVEKLEVADLILLGHVRGVLAHHELRLIHQVLEHVVDIAAVLVLIGLTGIDAVAAVEIVLELQTLGDVLIDGNAHGGIAVFIAQEQRRRAQRLALLGVLNEIVIRTVVLGCVADVFQPQNIAGAADLAAGDVPVADIHDRVLVIPRQIMEHELDIRPEMRLQQIHQFMQPFFVFLIR